MPKLSDIFNNSEKVPVNRTGTSSVYNPFMEINKGFDVNYIDDFITSETGVSNTPLRLQDDYKTYVDRGIFLNDVNTLDELNKERAINQSHFEQFGNFLMQAGVGEVILGSLEGFGNIWDGAINLFSGGDNYERSAWTEFWEKQKEDLKNNFAIYRENPNESFDFSDFGYWMEEGVNVATTLSLMLPAAGWAKGLSMLGKLTKLNKLGNWALRGVSRGLAKASTTAVNTGKFGALKSIAGKAGRIEASTKAWGGAGMQALLSRTGENYMEAKVIYDDIYKSSLDNLNNMPDEEFAKFLANNQEFKDMSKDDIAKEIANKSANKTFWNDYWMLVNDVLQFKALGSLFGKGPRRVPTASERIAATNIKRTLAGKTDDELIKDTFWNRTKESFKYAFKNPKDSFVALNTQEGFEEMFQGIQSEKGMEVASKYFDPKFTPRTITSYLTDSTIWEQGFWGMIGAIAFNAGYSAYRKGDRAVTGLWNKKHMTPEDYENWKRSEDKIAIENLNNVTARAKQFTEDMQAINDGKNPHKFKIDTITGELVLKDGVAQEEEINEEEKDLLKQQTIDGFVTDVALQSVDNGTYDLLKEIVGGTEFDKYIADNGYKLSNNEKALSQQIVNRMEEVAGIYNTALTDIDNLTDSVNPYVVRAAARNITRNKLMVDDYNNQINNVNLQLNKTADINSDYFTYEERVRYNNARKHLNNLQLQLNQYKDLLNEGKISLSAYNLHKENIDKSRRIWLNYLANNTEKGLFNSVREALKNKDNTTEDVLQEFDKFIQEYNKLIKNDNENREVPADSIIDLINKKVGIETRLNYTTAQIPITREEHQQLYEEFAMASDQMTKNRINDYVDLVKDYLRKADNFNEAYQKVLNENTGNKKVDEALTYLKYGYITYNFNDARASGQLNINLQFNTMLEGIKKERDKTEDTNQAAKEEGLEMPIEEPKEIIKEPKTTTDPNPVISTGDKAESAAEITKPNLNDNSSQHQSDFVVDEQEKQPKIDDVVIDVPAENNSLNNKEEEIITNIDKAFKNERDDIKGDAIKYLTQLNYKETGRIDEISKSLYRNDKTKYEALIEEVVNVLKSRGYKNETLIRKCAEEAFSAMLTNYSSTGSETAFGRLAEALARGFTEEGAKKYSATQLLDGEGINEALDEFLEGYSKEVGGLEYGTDKYLINLESLFNFLLNNENVSRKTAIDIYNNIMEFIAKNDESKYIFTGFRKNQNLSAIEYFNKLNHYKAQIKNSFDMMHIHPVETEYRDSDYENALVAAHNGAKTYLKEERDKNGTVTNLGVYVQLLKGKRTKEVKVGILRTVQTDADLKSFTPTSYYSGFKNVITINGKNEYSLDCDDFFHTLIHERKTNIGAKELLDNLIHYYLIVANIQANRSKIGDKEASIRLNAAMSEEMADRIMSNGLIKKLLEQDKYRFYNNGVPNNVKARQIAFPVAAILFKGMVDGISTLPMDLEYNYSQWKASIYNNYLNTYELQKSFNDENQTVDFVLEVNTDIEVHKIKRPDPYKNIGDLAFDVDPNSARHTPLVYIMNGKVIDEYGNEYGNADPGIGDNSMGFLIYNENNVRHIAYCISAEEMKNTEMSKALRNELTNIIVDHLNIDDTNPQKRYDKFIELRDKLYELFSNGGLFYNKEIRVTADKNGAWVGLKDINGRNLITLFRKASNGEETYTVGVYNPNTNNEVFTRNINKNGWDNNGNAISSELIKKYLGSALDSVVSEMQLNRSKMAVTNKGYEDSSSRIFRRENGKFIVTLGKDKNGNPKEYVYENYGDFILKNKGFTTDVYNDEKNNFVTRLLDTSNFNITGKIKDNSDTKNLQNTNVSDLLFINPNEKRKTVDTEDILLAAGVSQEAIDVLLGTKTGIRILTSRVYTSSDEHNDDGKTNAYYSNNNIYITDKGAASMNNNPKNAIRLLVHENIHRAFANKNNLTKAQKDRILKELKELYEYVRNELNKDLSNGRLTQEQYNNIIKVLDTATSYGSDEVNMEEFLCESLTQPLLVEYLNNTEYKEEVDISGINEKKKSIFQKIIDVLLKLFGINSGNIKNNSILAKEYLILSKTAKATTDKTGLFADNYTKEDVKEDSKKPIDKSPVEKKQSTRDSKNKAKLKDVKNEIDEVINGFSQRVKRSDNFEEDHIYYIDGKPADYSVTQKIHGKPDIGKYKVPSSCLGNTLDGAARTYFENDNNLPDNYHVPNVTDEENLGFGARDDNSRLHLKEELDKIKSYFDEKFGKGKYEVITNEFPIAGTIVVNGQEKTIAGTMDMIVYDNKGNIYIYDFKTKLVKNGDGNLSSEDLIGYSQQLNIYKELIEANYPQLKGRIKLGGLIKFNVSYPTEFEDVKYRENPNSKNQLQIDTGNGFKNIQDSLVDYTAPFIVRDLNYHRSLVRVNVKKYGDEIKALPKLEESKEIKIEGEELFEKDRVEYFDIDDVDDIDFNEDEEIEIGEFKASATEFLDIVIEDPYEKELQDILDKAPRNEQGQLLAPNKKPSNLTERQYAQVRTREFKEWFGDWENDPQNASKVVDENGEPLVVYHGTPWGEFTEFKHFQPNTGDRTKPGALYFGTSKFMVQRYTRGDYNKGKNQPKVYEVFLNIKNPYYNISGVINSTKELIDNIKEFYDAINNDNIYQNIVDKTLSSYNLTNETNGKFYNYNIYEIISNYYKDNNLDNEFNNFTKRLINDKKHDGMFFVTKEELDTKNIKLNNKQIWVINPNQIKSATGNIGTFSKENDNIYKAATELLDNNKLTRAEIYAPAIVNGSADNVFGVTLVNDISEFVSSFPQQYRENIRQILDSDELNYTCS